MKPFFLLFLVLLLSWGSSPQLFANQSPPPGQPVSSHKPQVKKGARSLQEGLIVAVIRRIDRQQGLLELETQSGQRLRAQGRPTALKPLWVGKQLVVWVTPDAIFLLS
jgi:hypothetical protein